MRAVCALVFFAAQCHAALAPSELRGRRIYRTGEAQPPIEVLLGNSDVALPGEAFPCANCHGLRAEGTNEGGLQPPPIAWRALASAWTSSMTGRQREAYNEVTGRRAILSGVDPAGHRLHAGMPAYRMSETQIQDLLAYLKKVGTEDDMDPGVTADRVRIGAALPLSGPLASAGIEIREALQRSIGEVNERGGIYGRGLELITEDSRGEAAEIVAATRRLIAADAFALVGSFDPSGIAAELLGHGEILSIGPITLAPRNAGSSAFYLLPGLREQARALVEFAKSQSPGSETMAMLSSSRPFDSAARGGALEQAARLGMRIAADKVYDPSQLDPVSAVELLRSKAPKYLLFFGNAGEFSTLAVELQRTKWFPMVLSCAAMLGSAPFQAPSEVSARVLIAYPGESVAGSVAFAAVQVLADGMRACGRELSRASLSKALEGLHELHSPGLPPITFGPNQHVGVQGAYIAAFDQNTQKFIRVGPFISPAPSR